MADHVTARLRALARVVADNYASALLTPSQRNPGHITRTDIPWSAPPLRSHIKLDGVPLTDYTTPDCDVDADALYTFWTANLKALWETPATTLAGGVFRGLREVMPGSRRATQAMAFAMPSGWPGKLEIDTGVMFSLEAAHLAICCIPGLRNVIDDDDNYFAELPDGRVIGVRDARPAVDSPWTDYQPSGLITDLTETMRGQAFTDCQYDQLAAVRSVMWDNDKMFPQFEALDLALQALRTMSTGGRCPNLLVGARENYGRVDKLKHIEEALVDAMDVMEANMSDRRKLQTLQGLLVPLVLSQTGFRTKIFSSANYPYTMAAGRADQIKAQLRLLYESEVPCSLRRNL